MQMCKASKAFLFQILIVSIIIWSLLGVKRCIHLVTAVYLSIYLSAYLPIYLFIFLSVYLSIYPSICPSLYLSINIYASISSSIYHLSIYLSFYLTILLRSIGMHDILRQKATAALKMHFNQQRPLLESSDTPYFLQLCLSVRLSFP